VSGEPEPVYKGKLLSTWARDYWRMNDSPMVQVITYKVNPEAAEALHQVGTNGIPTFLRWLGASDAPEKTKIVGWLQRRGIRINYTPAEAWHQYGLTGFRALGTNAQAAVPSLISVASQGASRSSRVAAIRALRHLGPGANAAVPELSQWATNSDADIRYYARRSLLEIAADIAVQAGLTNEPEHTWQQRWSLSGPWDD
jgi:hypothetical protein